MLPGRGCRLPTSLQQVHCSRERMLFIYNECVRHNSKMYLVEIYFLNRGQGLLARAVLLFLALRFKSPEYQAGHLPSSSIRASGPE